MNAMNFIFKFFRNNHILAICEEAHKNKSFTLNLSRFDIAELPELVEKCRILLKLFLNHNHLTQLPENLINLHRLMILTLDYNRLIEFPIVVCRLPTLRFLNISCNQIKVLPPEIGHLTALETFWCNNTGLESIPEEIGNLELLETLGLRGNCLQQLPSSIGLLRNLRWLTVENNKLNELPNSFKALQKLVHLNLKDNHFRAIPFTSLRELKKLQFVFFSNNLIEIVPLENDLEATRFMKLLSVIGNPIVENDDARLDFKNYKHILYESPQQVSPGVFTYLAAGGRNDNDNEDLLDDDDGDAISDWENSVETSDLDTTDESGDENGLEDISILIPEISKYATNFS